MYKKITLTLLLSSLISFPAVANGVGNLVIIGGGDRPPYLLKKIIEMSGGNKSRLLIIPNASAEPLVVGESQKKEFSQFAPENVEYLIFDAGNADRQENLDAVEKATAIFFSGGDQNKLVQSLKGTKLFQKINELYHNKKGVLAGTSAGAAVMSEIMLTGEEAGDEKAEFKVIKKENVKTAPGFSFVKKAIIDQHFIARKRQNRLLSLSLEKPELLAIGIDESTALIVSSEEDVLVLGENTVMIFDASGAKTIETDKNKNFSATGVVLHILKSGDSINLKTKKIKKAEGEK